MKPGQKRHAPLNPVQLAVNQAGGAESCAQMLKVSLRSVYLWMRRGNMRGVAAELVLQLSIESGISPANLVGLVERPSPRRKASDNGKKE